jgi:RNA polymerase sigma factor (TIGR02999 family)
LLSRLAVGDRSAESSLIEAVYPELRRIAARQLRSERDDHALQATALVNEAYLRLVGRQNIDWRNRAHFFGVAAQAMRRILVDYARSLGAQKRGGGKAALPFDEAMVFSRDRATEVIAVHEALTRLAVRNEEASRVVELRFFAGLSVEETAEALQISTRSVKRKWAFARAWLHAQLRSHAGDEARTTGTN